MSDTNIPAAELHKQIADLRRDIDTLASVLGTELSRIKQELMLIKSFGVNHGAGESYDD